MNRRPLSRRAFLKSSTGSGAALALAPQVGPAAETPEPAPTTASTVPTFAAAAIPALPTAAAGPQLPNLTPARWIWYPSGRCLPNTFVLFRRELALTAAPRRATGWITADSRYRLEVNGQRVQWGPAPCDPRWQEADPINLTTPLRAGRNVVGATVLHYGHGDGTWPIGKPGFLFWLEVEYPNGLAERWVSDAAWQSLLCRAWTPGHYKRWYLRALQEEFDARLYPWGWSHPDFQPGPDWLSPMLLEGSPQLPAICTHYPDYQLDTSPPPPGAALRPRTLPPLREYEVPVTRLAESFRVEWRRPPLEYFESRVPNAFTPVRESTARDVGPGQWEVDLDGRRGALLTFELQEQIVGWPHFVLEAPAGTTVELLVHEAHDPAGPPLLNTHFDSWTRFVCRAGENRFEPFDFESLRWLQLHVHGPAGTVRIRDIAVRRRLFPWPNEARVRCSEPALQRLFNASVNTLHNCAQETLVDGMARERQQYSGDCGHQLHALYPAFGETRLPARYLATFSQGLTPDGYFLDCWPAFDRLARVMERAVGLSGWGPILDHGVGFVFDCFFHHLYTGDLDALREPYPRLLHFARYLSQRIGPNGLLPVEDLGVPSVWIDHNAYQRPRHKHCAFNLYTAAMFRQALAPLCRLFGDLPQAQMAERLADQLYRATVKHFWNTERGLFVVNQPWLAEESQPRLCDRSLATALLFEQCPDQRIRASLEALITCPSEMGFSYPANAGWRLWALAQEGCADVVLADLRRRWATMASVTLNNTLQEDWEARPDSGQQWSHCAVAPLYLAYMGLAGLRPLAPGYQSVRLRPQPADLEEFALTAHTVRGPITFATRGRLGDRQLTFALPAGCQGEVMLPDQEQPRLPALTGGAPKGWRRFRVPSGKTVELQLLHV